MAFFISEIACDSKQNVAEDPEERHDLAATQPELTVFHIHFAYTLYKLHNTLAISRHRLGRVDGIRC